MPGKRIFLSYANEDRSRIVPLLRAFQRKRWSVFWDRKIPVGKTWSDVLEAEISTCRSVVVVWSKGSVKSDWVKEEASEGKKRGVLFPVRIDEVRPPFGYRQIQAANLVDWDGSSAASSFKDLARNLGALFSEQNRRLAKRKKTRIGRRKGRRPK